MPNPAAPVAMTTAADTITVTNRGAPFDDDAQVIFELSTATTFVGAVMLFQTQRTSTSDWTNAAVFDLSALGSSLTGNQSLTDSTNYSFIMPYASGFYGKRAKLVNTLGSGTLTASATGLSVKESIPMPIPVVVSSATAATTITAASATAFVVGPNGVTNPAFTVATNTASAATGIKGTAAAAASGFDLTVTSSGTNENLTLNAKGSGTISLNPTGTGNVILGDAINLQFNTTTGTKIASGTTQKLAFWNATPIVQPANTVDYVTMLTNLGLRATGGTAAASFPGGISSSSSTAGIGYATGAGGVVTQSTNKTTGVTLNKVCGAITMNNAALAAGAEATFTVTNSAVAVTDLPYAIHSSAGTSGSYLVNTSNVTAGTFDVTVSNVSAGSLSEAIVLTVYVHKAVAA